MVETGSLYRTTVRVCMMNQCGQRTMIDYRILNNNLHLDEIIENNQEFLFPSNYASALHRGGVIAWS